jgi:hypothetical protein
MVLTFLNTNEIMAAMDTITPQQMVRELTATGLTQQDLADLVPCSRSLIAAMARGARGKRPSYEIGIALERLHARLCRRRGGKALADSE